MEAIREYEKAAMKTVEGQPEYVESELQSLIQSAEMSLEESIGWTKE